VHGDPLAGVALDGVAQERRRYADIEALTLSVRYDFSADLWNSLLQPSQDPEFEQAWRTLYHETLHLYQLIATPYGAYLSHLADAQAAQVLTVIRELRDLDVPVRLPLGAYVDSLPRDDRLVAVRAALQAWRIIEVALLYLEGGDGALRRAQRRLPSVETLLPEQLFNLCDELLRLLSGPGVDGGTADGFYWPAHEPASPLVPPNSREDAARMRSHLAGKLMGLDAMAVLEHTAKVAEYWGRSDRRRATDVIHSGRSVRYDALGVVTLHYLGELDVPVFVRTVLALGELALFAPLLPSQHAFRRPGLTALDMHPLPRFEAAARVAAELPRLRGGDVGSYHEAICERLGWPTPGWMSSLESQAPEPIPNANISLRLYWEAQRFRAEHIYAFVDLDVWRAPAAPFVQRFRTLFSHPVMEFRGDRSWVHKNRELVFNLLLRYVLHKYLRRLVMTDDLTVSIPLRVAADLLPDLTDAMRVMLGDAGLRNPTVRLRTVPPHAAGAPLAAAT
jgi:hypothetical protein